MKVIKVFTDQLTLTVSRGNIPTCSIIPAQDPI